jgi:hypothetical protein
MGRIVTSPAEDPHEDLGARADHLEAAEVEVEHEGRRVRPSQGTIKREGREVEGLRPALRRHDLEDVARADVLLGLLDRREIIGLGEVRHGLGRRRGLPEPRVSGTARSRSRTASITRSAACA